MGQPGGACLARIWGGEQRIRGSMRERGSATAILHRFRPVVDEAIGRVLAGRPDLLIYEMIRYHLGLENEEAASSGFGGPSAGSGSPIPQAQGNARAESRGGKRVRAAMCLLSCEAACGRADAAAPAGAAVELVHSFTLLHDDIADRDEVRRGRPTVWLRWGVGQAITAGDALFALANLAGVQLEANGVPPDTVARVLEELNQATLTVCEGQQLDISYEGSPDIGVHDYLPMIERKTAALFAAACSIGARVAGAAERKRAVLTAFGREVGLGFQITDDVLGIWGDPGEMGKPVGGDLRRNKRSLPVIHALHSADPGASAHLADRLAAGVETDEEAADLAALMERLGARQFCDQMARECLDRGLAALESAQPEPAAARDLRTLASFLIERSR